MAKTPAQLDREIQSGLGLPAEVMKRWRTKVAAYKRAVADVEAGYSEAGWRAMMKARDALDKAIDHAAAHAPYTAGRSPYLAEPVVALSDERKDLVSRTWEAAQVKGREANYRANRAKSRQIDEEIREANRPYEWMKR